MLMMQIMLSSRKGTARKNKSNMLLGHPIHTWVPVQCWGRFLARKWPAQDNALNNVGVVPWLGNGRLRVTPLKETIGFTKHK